eukprot:COSAG01_NODE_59727_length_298_cov_1.814070_1_plen_35_part_10
MWGDVKYKVWLGFIGQATYSAAVLFSSAAPQFTKW